MSQKKILHILQQVQNGTLSPEEAMLQLKMEPFQDLGYAKVDHHRELRQGTAEVIYGAGKTGEQILIDKDMFRIGKEPNYADYCIRDNSAVSRSHAVITVFGGQYYVTDTNSTNHTFVDDRMIQSNNQTEIMNGSKIKFGNEEFEFRLI